MKITKSQLRKIIKEEFNSEADSIARDQAGQIGQENYDILDKVGDALVKGGDATNWVLDNDEWQSLIVPTSDADMPEFIEAIETVLSNNLGMSIKQLLGLKENKMKITKSQLRKVIKEELLKEAGGFPGRRFGGSMADLDTDAATRETDFLKSAQGVTDADVREKAIMMVGDILDIVDTESESGRLLVSLHQFLQSGY